MWKPNNRGRRTTCLPYLDAPGSTVPAINRPNVHRLLNLALNKTGGDWDNEAPARLLAELRDDDTADESLTGFPDDEITRLLESLEDESSPVPVPCDEIDYRVMIDCVDGEHQLELLEWLAREGLTCRALV